MSHACHPFWKCHKTLTFCSLLTRCTIPCACHAKRHPNVQKCSIPFHTPHFFALLTSKCASRHNGVHFFDISTSKSGPDIMCFVHFDFQMCFAPQRRALFRHRNISQRQKVLWPRQFLTLLTWKRASRHNGVQFFISHLASWLRTRRFSEPTFRPSGATNHWKNTSVSRLSYLFAHLDFFSSEAFSFWSSSLLFSSLTLPISAFHLSILLEVWLQKTSFDNTTHQKLPKYMIEQ